MDSTVYIVKEAQQIRDTLKVENKYMQDQILAKPAKMLSIELIP